MTTRTLAFSLLLPSLSFAAPGPRKPLAVHLKDPESFLSQRIKAQRLLGKGDISRFRGKKVPIGPKSTASLRKIYRSLFAGQKALRTNLRRISPGSGVLLGRPVAEDQVYEFADAFVLVASTSVTVVNPGELSRRSPQFRTFLGSRTSKRVSLSGLPPESLRGLDDFIKNELPKRPANDPLKIAASKGKVALLTAIAEGKGLYETVEEIVIPKQLPPVVRGVPQLPVLSNGVFLFNRYRPPRSALIRKISAGTALRRRTVPGTRQVPPRPTSPSHMTKVHMGRMKKVFTANFMTGFTLGSNWEYCKTWRFDSGLFRIRLGAGYAVGLRFPIQVTGEIRPTHISTVGPNDVTTAFETQLTARPIGADCSYYNSTGMDPESSASCGKELALDFYFAYGLKFRACWTTVLNWPYKERHTDPHSADFTPPFNRNRGGLKFWIPAELTHTKFSAAVIKGSAQAGVKLSGTGTVELDYESFHGNEKSRRVLTFTRPSPVKIQNSLPPLTPGSGQATAREAYGFKLDNPVYKIHPTLTPGVRAQVTLGYKWFSRTIRTGDMWISALEMPLLPVTFTRHRGTTSQFRYGDGRKQFTRR